MQNFTNTYHAKVSILILQKGYREASINGARLIVRADGSESWANVKSDSLLYAVLNGALFATP